MKTLMLMLAILASAIANGVAQGDLIFSNNTRTRITNALTGDAWWGPDSNLLRVVLYASPGANQPESSLTVQAHTTTNLFGPGIFFGGTRIMPWYGDATVQVRAWGASTLYPTYEAAFAAGSGGDSSVLVGSSALMSLRLGLAPSPPAPLNAYLQPFLVQPVPEPSVWALGLLGALVLLPLLRRRRHQSTTTRKNRASPVGAIPKKTRPLVAG